MPVKKKVIRRKGGRTLSLVERITGEVQVAKDNKLTGSVEIKINFRDGGVSSATISRTDANIF